MTMSPVGVPPPRALLAGLEGVGQVTMPCGPATLPNVPSRRDTATSGSHQILSLFLALRVPDVTNSFCFDVISQALTPHS